MGYEDFDSFRKNILHTLGKRKHDIKNSWGTYDAYKLIRKNHWYDIGSSVGEHEFYILIRTANRLLAEELSKGNTVVFPYRMGQLELRKFHPSAKFAKGKLKVTYPIDWDKTLRLWYADPEAKKAKTLIRMEESTIYRIRYNKCRAVYNNKQFYAFSLNTDIKKALKKNIKNGTVDAIYDEPY